MHSQKRLFKFSFFLLSLIIPFVCSAAVFTADWGNYLYMYENRLDTLKPPLNYYENLNLQMRKIGGSDISAYAGMTTTNGFKGIAGGIGKKDIELNHAMLQWDNIGNFLKLQLGRQLTYYGPVMSYIDGLRFTTNFANKLRISGHAGARVPSRYSNAFTFAKVPSDSNGFDAALRIEGNVSKTQVGLTYNHGWTPSETDGQFLEFDFSQFLGKSTFTRGALVYDALNANLSEFQIAGSSRFSVFNLSGNFSRINRSIEDSSNIFLVRTFKNYYEAYGNIQYNPVPELTAGIGYLARLIDNSDPAHELNAEFDYKKFDLNFSRKWGYGGWETRVSTGLDLLRFLIFNTHLDGTFFQYSGSGSQNINNSWIGDFSIDAAAPDAPWWNITAGIQALGNPYYVYDFRAYLQSRIRFSRFFQ